MPAASRREFFLTAAAAAFPTSCLTGRLHRKVRVGFIGVGRTGSRNMACAARVPGFEIAAVCDVFPPALDAAAAQAGRLGFEGVRFRRNFDSVLEDGSIDAVCISAPEGRRASMLVAACQAGKDVWVEAPVCAYVEEGPRMVRAARQYNRVAQAGAVGRSDQAFERACQAVKSGALGDIAFCRASDGRGRGVHWLDMLQGAFDEAMPFTISAQGGGATFRYPGFVASYESRGGAGVSFHGSKATLVVDAAGCFLHPDGARPMELSGRAADARTLHWRNFLDCIRSRRRPPGRIETCGRATATCLLSDLALRRGVTLEWDERAFAVRPTASRDT